jgi:hypothetical protein
VSLSVTKSAWTFLPRIRLTSRPFTILLIRFALSMWAFPL